MRKIIFRGRDIAGNWHYGDLEIISDDLCKIVNHKLLEYGKVVDRDTVGQYTGLTDNKGEKIFEGDIVKHDFEDEQIGEQYAVVDFSCKYASFMISPINDWMYCDKNDCEVIGNIHDNPELLKGDSENESER